jgi:hypothetical protein
MDHKRVVEKIFEGKIWLEMVGRCWKECTRAVQIVSSRFKYLENRSCGLDVTWRPVRGDFTVPPWTVTVPWGQSVGSATPLSLCTVWPSHSHWPSEQIIFITTMRLPILQLSYRLFWQSITSLRSVIPHKAKIWLPSTSGSSQS